MSNKLDWAKEYQSMLEGARKRNFERFNQGIEEVPSYYNAVNVQSWLEELSIAIIADEEPVE